MHNHCNYIPAYLVLRLFVSKPSIVAKVCANVGLDMNRIYNMKADMSFFISINSFFVSE